VYLLVFHAYINEMHGRRSEIPSKNLVHIYIYIYTLNFGQLSLSRPPPLSLYIYIYDISRLRVSFINILLCYVEYIYDFILSLHHGLAMWTTNYFLSMLISHFESQ
jgi:hypothetical protein